MCVECRTTGGKPTLATYEYASSLLYSAIESARTGTSIDLHANASKGMRPRYEGKVYMVGDNPRSDIAGEFDALLPFLREKLNRLFK